MAVDVVVVHDVGQVETLAMEISQLLHLQTTLVGDSLGDSLAQKHDALSLLELLCHCLREWIDGVESLLHVHGEATQLGDVLGPDSLGLIVTLSLREPQSHQGEDNNLRDVGLGGGD